MTDITPRFAFALEYVEDIEAAKQFYVGLFRPAGGRAKPPYSSSSRTQRASVMPSPVMSR